MTAHRGKLFCLPGGAHYSLCECRWRSPEFRLVNGWRPGALEFDAGRARAAHVEHARQVQG